MTGKKGWNVRNQSRPYCFSAVYTIFGTGKLIQIGYGLSERLLELYEGEKKMVANPDDNYLFAAWTFDCV
jgi:hypothetical protein